MNEIFILYAEQLAWDFEHLSSMRLGLLYFLPFFCVKWCFITIPFWLPTAIIAGAIRGVVDITVSPTINNGEEK